MRHPAPFFFLLTLFIVTKMRISQYSQQLKLILALSFYSYHLPTVTKSGGTSGGMILPLKTNFFSNEQQRV